ncbi:hypothetical protein B0H67DRAFT_647991 [Lasiosphaeris hirsuta]|uniref:Uncharacterized protein n=1 Tax=Lasiosphaeris hirsuta TaxID=260670 RepID=A0AA40A1Z8_9PEZI|nr:hypothetical protein B0H67DRAFT_647991 [Lasiosphaeris hirsuta]
MEPYFTRDPARLGADEVVAGMGMVPLVLLVWVFSDGLGHVVTDWRVSVSGDALALSLSLTHLARFPDTFTRSACHPDGNFSPFSGDYDWWAVSGIFQVTLGFGSLTFTQAKVVDVVWDVIVGQIGQFAASVISFKVFTDYVTVSMATTPVTYVTFWTIYLHQETSVRAWIQLMREFWSGGVLKSKIAIVFIAYAMLFLISIPTLAGAMTGYTPIIDPFIRRNDSSLIPFRELAKVSYIIQDGSRVGLTDNYVVPSPSYSRRSGYQYDPVSARDGSDWISDGYGIIDCVNPYRLPDDSAEREIACLLSNVSSYVSQYGFYGLNNTPSTWLNVTLDRPALNITTFYLPDNSRGYASANVIFGHSWVDPRTGLQPFADPQRRTYYDAQNFLYSLDYVTANGSCQPSVQGCDATTTTTTTTTATANNDACSAQIYQWGFSLVQATLSGALAIVWTAGLYALYLAAHLQLPLVDTPEIPRGWRAVMLLGDTIRRELDAHGIDPDRVTDKQLKRMVRRQLRGGRVSMPHQLANPSRGFRQAWRQWLAREKWWLVSFFVGTAVGVSFIFGSLSIRYFSPGAIFLGIFGIAFSVLSGGILLALIFAGTKTGKWIFAILFGIFGLAIGTYMFAPRYKDY